MGDTPHGNHMFRVNLLPIILLTIAADSVLMDRKLDDVLVEERPVGLQLLSVHFLRGEDRFRLCDDPVDFGGGQDHNGILACGFEDVCLALVGVL